MEFTTNLLAIKVLNGNAFRISAKFRQPTAKFCSESERLYTRECSSIPVNQHPALFSLLASISLKKDWISKTNYK
jgi:hypothetical protein